MYVCICVGACMYVWLLRCVGVCVGVSVCRCVRALAALIVEEGRKAKHHSEVDIDK